MTDSGPDPLAMFVENIVRNLEKNGFPERRVSFPLERMYESAHAKGVSFNAVLEQLATRGIGHEKTPEKVVFVRLEHEAADVGGGLEHEAAAVGANPFAGFDLRAFEGMSPEQLLGAAASLMQQMSPEQLAAMRGMVEGLSEEQKAELVERARKLGLF